jgi:hypothetical protein
MKRNRVWVIEMNPGRKWYPVYGEGIDKPAAQLGLIKWRKACPNDKFRIRPYYAEGE